MRRGTNNFKTFIRPVFARVHGSRFRKPLYFGAAALLAGSVYGLGANGYVVAKTRDHIYSHHTEVPAREVAIVLGAKVYRSGKPSAVLEDRLLAAVRLYEAGKVKKVIVSGDHMAKEYDEPNAMRQFLRDQGIPSRDIYMDHAGLRTFDTMARAADVFGVNSAVICTQKFHLARSVYLARHNGIDAVGLQADLRRYRSHRTNQAREFIARSFALLDAHLFGTEPRHRGPAISMNEDPQPTHDRWTRP